LKVIAALTDSTLDRLLQPVGWVERQRNPLSFAETRAIVGSIDVIDEKTQAALSQISREEKAAAADKVSPIVRHRASMAQQKVMGFAEPVIEPATSGRTRWLNPSYGLLQCCRMCPPGGGTVVPGRCPQVAV
jgi:hypothetical protein